MDDFRVGSISPYDPIRRQPGEGSENRKRRKHSDLEIGETEDVVSLSENGSEDEESPEGYAPLPKPGD